jgi:uncharacterized protein (DUF433 family)
MQTHEKLFTTTEAAVLTQLSIKAVNNAIDRKIVPTVADRKAGQPIRLLDLRALLSLALERRLADRFALDLRLTVFGALAETPRNAVSLDGGFLRVDLREPRRELATAIRALRRARRLVVSDPDIMGGEPVFRGTRVSVHQIASLLGQGSTVEELLAGFPRLTEEMVRLAPLFAAAHPLRGRPRLHSWRDRQPTQSIRRQLATIGAQ